MHAIWSIVCLIPSAILLIPNARHTVECLPVSFNSNACSTVDCLPDNSNSNACLTVIEDSVNSIACPTWVDGEVQRFELSHLLSLDVLPFLKLLFRKFVIPNDSELSDDLCLTHVVAMFEQLCAKYAFQGLMHDQFSSVYRSVQKLVWSKILLFLESNLVFFADL